MAPDKKGPAKRRRKSRRAQASWQHCDGCAIYAPTYGNRTAALIAALQKDVPFNVHTNQNGGVHFAS